MEASDAHAALERGRAAMIVTPPAVEQASAVWELLATGLTIIVCSDRDAAATWSEASPPTRRVHGVTGLDRTTRLLKDGAIDVLAGTPEDLQTLASRSALKLDDVTTVVLAWPEGLIASDRLGTVDQLLGEQRDARRIVLTWNPQALDDLVERHARRPHVVGDLPLGEDARPLPPAAAARYVVVPHARRQAGIPDILDAVNRARVAVWRRGDESSDPQDAIVCLDLPSRAELTRIARRGAPILVLAPAQLPYARSIAAPLTPLPLLAALERADAATTAIRNGIVARLAAGGLEAELGLLEPLLRRYDAAEVAAAVLAVREPPPPHLQPPTPSSEWVKVFVNVGRKDRASAKDFVGALTREVGLARTDIGRVELRDAFCLLEIAAPVADQAIVGLGRTTIRGKRPAARRDRAG